MHNLNRVDICLDSGVHFTVTNGIDADESGHGAANVVCTAGRVEHESRNAATTRNSDAPGTKSAESVSGDAGNAGCDQEPADCLRQAGQRDDRAAADQQRRGGTLAGARKENQANPTIRRKP